MKWDSTRLGLLDELAKIAAFNTNGLSPETVMSKSQPPPPMETPGFDKARDILGRASQTKTAAKKRPPQDVQNRRAVAFQQPGIGKMMTAGDSSAPEQAKSVAGYGLAGLGTGSAVHKAYTAAAPGVHDAMRNPLHDAGSRFAAEAKNNRLGRNLMLGGTALGAGYGAYRAHKKARMAKQGTMTKLSTLTTPALQLKASKQVGKAKVTPSSAGPNTTTQIRGQLIGKKGIT